MAIGLSTTRKRRVRSRLPRDEARRLYIQLGEEALIEQIEARARALDTHAETGQVEPVGVFATLDAAAVAERLGKTRGSISNIFGSQRAFQAATMMMTLEDFQDGGGVHEVTYPTPAEFANAEDWIAAIAAIEAVRGPHHGRKPRGYAARWILWLTQVPYEIWSDRAASASASEFAGWANTIKDELVEPALEHFGYEMRPPLRSIDLAIAMANLVEGLWISQCVTDSHPVDVEVAVKDAARNAFLMLWRGATMRAAR